MGGFLGTKAGFYSDLSLIWEILLVITFVLGYYYARKHRGSRHHKVMLVVFAVDALFFSTYMIKSLIEGRTSFGGPENIYRMIYLPIVIVHSLISIVALVMGAYMVYNGFKSAEDRKGKKILVKNPKRHRRVGILTLAAFGISALTGFVIYWMLYVLY